MICKTLIMYSCLHKVKGPWDYYGEFSSRFYSHVLASKMLWSSHSGCLGNYELEFMFGSE